MLKLAILMVEIWNYRFQVILPLILLPLMVMAWSFAYSPMYEATTTLSVDRVKASSPVLMNASDPGNSLILERRLKSEGVIRDTILDTGAIVGFDLYSKSAKEEAVREFSSRIKLHIFSDDMLRINFKAKTPEKAEQVLEYLSGNFIDEILAPERVRVGDLLSSLGNQVQLYSEQEKRTVDKLNILQEQLANTRKSSEKEILLKQVVAVEFNAQKAEAQKDLAQNEYEDLLLQSRSLMGGQFYNEPNAIMWIVDPAISLSPKRDMYYHLNLLFIAFQAAVVLALILVLNRRFTDKTLRKDDEIYELLGLKILGHIPNIGSVETDNGRLIINTQSKIL
ncbi:MAG: capsular polysaccharide biosynthesis protein [Alphaproteobacteria bacterium]|jgi:capsular polysaccharide biosynthesis protein